VTGLRVMSNETGEEYVLETDGIFPAIGHKPNTSFLNGQIMTDALGYIKVKPGTTETNIPGVFAKNFYPIKTRIRKKGI
jgi:thioredoxin reductase (NADPH)